MTLAYNFRTVSSSLDRNMFEVFHSRTKRVVAQFTSFDGAMRYMKIMNQIAGELERPRIEHPKTYP